MFQTTTKTFQLNPRKRIGTVVIFVEGASDEFEILNHIFINILGYKTTNWSRRDKIFKEAINLKSTSDNSSSVFILNTKDSNIRTILDMDYRDEIYHKIFNNFGIDLHAKPVYYLWDRDAKSNMETFAHLVVEMFSSAYPYEKDAYFENGLALLSYPAVEAYLISNFGNSFPEDNFKKYVKEQRIKTENITASTLLSAAEVMYNSLVNLGVSQYDIDDFGSTNQEILMLEENRFRQLGRYLPLSLISVMLLDLGIIQEKE